MKKKFIYIVEDDSDIRDAFNEILTAMDDYKVEAAENGQMALEYLKGSQELPDLILLDVLMPVMDGFGFREEQLKDPRLKNIPIVVLSASHRITDLAERMQARAYLKKPISIEDLLGAIEEHA